MAHALAFWCRPRAAGPGRLALRSLMHGEIEEPAGPPGGDLSEPVLTGEGASDYERYLRTDALLSLQTAPEDWVHRDELLFQTVHQSSELWLKLATTEVAEATRLIERGDHPAAI